MSETIEDVLRAERRRLMALPGVTGVAEGRLDDGTPCVVLFLDSRADLPEDRLPRTLRGHPVRIEGTDGFEARSQP